MKSSLGRAMEQQFGGRELLRYIPPFSIRDFKPKNPYVRIISTVIVHSKSPVNIYWIAEIIVKDKDSGIEKSGEFITTADSKKQAVYNILHYYYMFHEGANSGWDRLWDRYLVRTGQK